MQFLLCTLLITRLALCLPKSFLGNLSPVTPTTVCIIWCLLVALVTFDNLFLVELYPRTPYQKAKTSLWSITPNQCMCWLEGKHPGMWMKLLPPRADFLVNVSPSALAASVMLNLVSHWCTYRTSLLTFSSSQSLCLLQRFHCKHSQGGCVDTGMWQPSG